jgi:hypothetical protein
MRFEGFEELPTIIAKCHEDPREGTSLAETPSLFRMWTLTSKDTFYLVHSRSRVNFSNLNDSCGAEERSWYISYRPKLARKRSNKKRTNCGCLPYGQRERRPCRRACCVVNQRS